MDLGWAALDNDLIGRLNVVFGVERGFSKG